MLLRVFLEIDKINDQDEKEICFNLVKEMWDSNYSNSLLNIKNTVLIIRDINKNSKIIDDLNDISFSIINSKLEIENILGLKYNQALSEIILLKTHSN